MARNWDRAHREDKMLAHRQSDFRPIATDQAFWRAWKDNATEMRRSGVVLRKTGGKWSAFIEIKK